MPIRFRCAYCNQLLGIARRKAGTVVRCPTCAGQVVVPTLDELPPEPDHPPAAPKHGGNSGPSPMFEGNEIDKLLEGAAGDQPSVLGSPSAPRASGARAPAGAAVAPSPAAAGPAPAPVPPSPFPGAAAPAPRPPGILLSPAKATLLSVGAVIGLAVAFAAGLLVGLFLHSSR